VARWLNGYVAAAVNRHAAADEIRVINRSQRTRVPANFFFIDNKPAARRVGYAGLTFINSVLRELAAELFQESPTHFSTL